MDCPEFIAKSFAVRTATHLLHLSSRSYAQHVALGDFYEALADKIDAYAEIYMGLEGHVASWPQARPPAGPAESVLADYLDLVQEEMDEDKDSQALMNILAEIEELTARTLYKLRFLK